MKHRGRLVGLSTVSLLASTLGACDDVGPYAAPSSSMYDNDAGAYFDDSGSEPPPNFADAGAPPFGPRPNFGPTVTQAVPPPAVSGGSLVIAHDGTTAIVGDPDRDAVYIVDLTSNTVRSTIALPMGSEPGRVVEDASGRVHVATRRGGELVSIAIATGSIVGRRAVCSVPRGVAYEASTDSVHVACAGGDLVTLPAAGGAATRTLHLESDLRDVVVVGGDLYVTRFRTAELLHVVGGAIADRSIPAVDGETSGVAWRAIGLAGSSGVAVVHQLSQTSQIVPAPGGYGGGMGGCTASIVTAAVSFWPTGKTTPTTMAVPAAVLPVDVAISHNAAFIAVAAAGNGFTPTLGGVVFLDIGSAPIDAGTDGDASPDGDVPPTPPAGDDGGIGCFGPRFAADQSQITSVAFDGSDRLIALQREPAALLVIDPTNANGAPLLATIALSTISRADTGHDIFHSNAGSFIACASCHAEGGDDARTWSFVGLGSRRTPSLRGTVGGTAPYHWDGAMRDFATLEHEIFEGRMSGPTLPSDKVTALASWVTAIPTLPLMAPVDAASAARGKALYEGSAQCSSCHSGDKHTNNATVDVGTGGAFQVPPLVGVAWRAPFLHAGCASTLTDRFVGCATPQHGKTTQLDALEIADLVSYLSTL